MGALRGVKPLIGFLLKYSLQELLMESQGLLIRGATLCAGQCLCLVKSRE